VLLQHPVEFNGVLGARSKGAHLSKVVPLGSHGLGVLDISFHAHTPKGIIGSPTWLLSLPTWGSI
jgi:hypothetical protein